MCRLNQMWGFVLLAFGVGLLIGTWVDGGFLCNCLGIALAIGGLGLSKRK